MFSVPGPGVGQGRLEARPQIGAVPQMAAGLAGTLQLDGTPSVTPTGQSRRVCKPSDAARRVFHVQAPIHSRCLRGRARVFPGRAGYAGSDADVGQELLLFGVELVVRGALAP
ncbi:hypothetical protein GCM10009863_64460 [Streptomyces axinellae]|uniref:Uncharacterized protein n=1 Tax=Streptomyces axinellae TaxID=552788 RepID=A0ABP6DBG8_9ACTN